MLRLEVVTPEKKVVDAEVDSVTIPTASGEVGIMPNHAPLISALKPGILSFSAKGTAERLVIAGGFVEVSNNTVAVLADSAETADEINESVKAAGIDDAVATGPMTVDEAELAREAADLKQARAALFSGR
jgi:F-type H+-transporting ATPase subunit epsilon